MSFQQIGDVASRVVARLAPRPLVTSSGKFDTQAIAARVNELWAERQEFLAQYDGEVLAWWRGKIWASTVEKAWCEASAAQTKWLIDNTRPVQTAAERLEYAALIEEQNRQPIYEHSRWRELADAKLRIARAARDRAFAAAMPAQFRTRAAALADVRMPGNELLAAE